MPQNYNACFPATTPPTLYTGTGTTTTFATGFPSLKQNDVVVFTGDNTTGVWNQAPQTDYAVNSQNANNVPQVVFNTAPGTDVLITRRTDLCVLVRNFQAGQSIRAQDLNNAFLQQLYLHQEMYSFLEQQFGGPLIPDGSTLQDTFWNKTTDVIDSGEAWVADDSHIATTLAGDNRWLNATGGNVIGGDGITVVEGGGNVTISQETLAPSPAGTFTQANIVVDDMGRITSAVSGGGGAGGGSVTVVADVAALNAAFAATPVGDVVQVADTTNIDTATVPAINFLPAAGTIEGGYGPNVRCNLVRAVADWTFMNLVFPNTDVRYVNITGDTMTGFLTLNADPTQAMHAATRQYVDAQATNPGNGALTVDGTNITVTTTGGQFTANKADATSLDIAIDDVFILNTGDNMGGALTYTPGTIADGVAWPIGSNNIFDCAGAFDVPEPAAGFNQNLTGIIRFAAPPSGWATANSIFQFSGGTPPTMTGACIVPYITSGTNVLIGQPTTNIS